MQVGDVHYEISRRAAAVANENLVADPRIPPQFIQVFRANGNRNIGLAFAESFNLVDPAILEAIQEIGRAALKQTLLENPGLFVGLILGEARRKKNYFTEHHR